MTEQDKPQQPKPVLMADTRHGKVFMLSEIVNIHNIEGTIIGYLEIERFSFLPTFVREVFVKIYHGFDYYDEDVLNIVGAVINHAVNSTVEIATEGYSWEKREQPHMTYDHNSNKYRIEFYKLMTEGEYK